VTDGHDDLCCSRKSHSAAVGQSGKRYDNATAAQWSLAVVSARSPRHYGPDAVRLALAGPVLQTGWRMIGAARPAVTLKLIAKGRQLLRAGHDIRVHDPKALVVEVRRGIQPADQPKTRSSPMNAGCVTRAP
jgi:hypothetical protein